MVKLTQAHRDRFDYGEIERDCARERQFLVPGGFWDRMFGWLQNVAKNRREDADAEIRRAENKGIEK